MARRNVDGNNKLHEESTRLMRMAVLLRNYKAIVSQLRTELTESLISSCDRRGVSKEGDQDLSVINESIHEESDS
jgi:hypothetical protein